MTSNIPVFRDAYAILSSDLVSTAPVRFLDGVLRDPVVAVDAGWESVESGYVMYRDGIIKEPLVRYDNGRDDVVSGVVEYINGAMAVKLITYSNWPLQDIPNTESIATATVVYRDGTLT